ncbi:Tetratricopeptide repeat protein 28 [Halocaridina rubra]|uniref:Tetratricopeptide repeat protein 28 n=1 Tax=Halocaridina rubra TaxID=373956 RepID=A0AAN8XCS6_HALRR
MVLLRSSRGGAKKDSTSSATRATSRGRRKPLVTWVTLRNAWCTRKMARKSPHCSLLAYYRQGVALQCLGRHADAVAAFSSGLAQDPKSLQLLEGLVEAAMKSPLRGKLIMGRSTIL